MNCWNGFVVASNNAVALLCAVWGELWWWWWRQKQIGQKQIGPTAQKLFVPTSNDVFDDKVQTYLYHCLQSSSVVDVESNVDEKTGGQI